MANSTYQMNWACTLNRVAMLMAYSTYQINWACTLNRVAMLMADNMSWECWEELFDVYILSHIQGTQSMCILVIRIWTILEKELHNLRYKTKKCDLLSFQKNTRYLTFSTTFSHSSDTFMPRNVQVMLTTIKIYKYISERACVMNLSKYSLRIHSNTI